METHRLLANTFLESHPDDAARVLERLSVKEASMALSEISPGAAAAIVQRMAIEVGVECIVQMAPEAGALIVGSMVPDAAARLVRRTDAEARERILGRMSSDVAAPLLRMLAYPQGTAGAVMDPRVLALPQDLLAGEALARVLESPHHAVYYVYVVDRNHLLVGVLNLRELMAAEPGFSLFSIMTTNVATITARGDYAAILAHPAWRKFHALPVVDNGGVFVGVIRYETLRQLEADGMVEHTVQPALVTALNLGQLWWIGLTGVLASLVAPGTTPHSDLVDRENQHG